MTSGKHYTHSDNQLRIIRDSIPVEDGGYKRGTVFSHTDMLQMLEHCAFSTGTQVEFRGCRYHILTINSPTGSKQILAELEIIEPKGE